MPLPSTGDFTSPQMAQRIVDEALVLSEGFRDAFTQAISEIVESAELIQLLQDIQAGQFVGLTPGVLDIIDAVEIEPDEMLRIQREALAQAADITNQETGLDFRFDIINPRAAQAALNIGSYLVRYVNDSVRERLREIIAEQVSGLLSVADARRMIRDRVGLLPQHAVAVQNYEAGLLASGMDPTRVQTLAARYSERLLRYRAEMISRTEVARATSVGQQEYWLQARDAGRLPPNTMRIWIVNIDELTCDICRPMQDSDPIGLEDYWTTVEGDTVYYPTQSHPNCRCTTGLVFPDLMNKVDPTGYERWLMTRPVQKHAEHDQQSHGNWARGRSGKFVGTETIDQLKEMGLEGDELQEALRSVREARESGRQEVGIVASRRGGFTTLTIYDTDNIWGKEGEVDIPVPEFWVSADNAYTTWSAYEGNYQIRKMSAVMMGLDAPKAEKGNFENPLFRAEVFGVDQLDEDERADLAVHHLYAEAMVSAIADADVTSRPLYRGLGDVPADSPIRNLQPGDEFSAPVSAWSDGRGLAEQFSGSGSGGVLLVMDGPKRAWKPEEYYYGAAIGEGDPFGEEVLSQGEFRVTGSETLPDGTLQVTVEQTYTYDIGGRSREVEKASKKRKKRAIPEWVMELMAGSVRQPVQKHANHDQKSHGNWARQGQLPGIDWDGFKISDIERLKRSIGLRPGQEIWQHPVMREAFWRGEVPDDEWEAQYQVIEYVEGEWAKFGPARQIRDAAEKLLGLEEPERGDPTLDPYQESGRDASWGGGEDRVSDEEAKVMALWFLEHSGQVEGKFYRGTEASIERMNLSEGDEFDVGLLSFTESPHTAASFGAETIFVVENPIGYQGEKLDMAVRYTDWDVDEFYNVVRTHAEKAELEDMYGEDIFVVGDLVREEVHPELFYDAFDSDLPNLDKEHLITGSYRIASIERVNPASGLRVSDMEPYATDKGEVLGVVDVVTLQPIDRDGDGIILEGTDEERFVGKAEKSRRPAWLRLFELSLGEMALASGAVKKHADHDQKSHGNWATGRATPKRFDRFTEGGGQRPGKRLYKIDGVWHEAKVRIGLLSDLDGDLVDVSYSIADNTSDPLEYEEALFDDYAKAREIIVDALNDVSPEFRPKAVVVTGGVELDGTPTPGSPPIGGAHYDPQTDTIEVHPAALGLTLDVLASLPDPWWETASPGLRPAFLRKLMIHELGHSIDWKIHQRTRVSGDSSWRTQRNQLASDWFEASEDLLDPEGPTTWYLHLNFTGADRYGGIHAPAELFAEWFANGFFSTPIPNSQMVDEVVNNLDLTNVLVPRDGDGDGLVFDGTGRERSA